MSNWNKNQFGDYNRRVNKLTFFITTRENFVEAKYIDGASERPFTSVEEKTFPAGEEGVKEAMEWLNHIAEAEENRDLAPWELEEL